MYVEQRIYTLKPGAAPSFFEFYEHQGRAVQIGHLGQPLGYYSTEIGPLNQVVMNWFYSSMAERTEKRQSLARDPAWIAYLKHAREFCVAQQTTILQPAPFFANQLKAYVQQGGRHE